MIERIWRNSLARWLRRFSDKVEQPQSQELIGKSDIKPLTPKENEHFFRQILEGVESGWTRVQVVRAFEALSRRSSEADWVAWLRGFGERLLASPNLNRLTANRLVKFGAIGYGELSQIAQEIGQKLLERVPVQQGNATSLEAKTAIQDAEAGFGRGIELFNQKDFIGAIACYDRVLEILPNAQEVWYNRGNALFMIGGMEEAIKSYDRALAIKPDKSDAWNNRGNALFELGQMEDAIASWEKAVELLPTYHQAIYNQGVVFGYLGRLESAIAAYDKVLQIKPDDHNAWFNRGLVLGNLGRDEEAIASWDKALEFNPNRYETWYNRSVALTNLGRTQEANFSLQQAEALKLLVR